MRHSSFADTIGTGTNIVEIQQMERRLDFDQLRHR